MRAHVPLQCRGSTARKVESTRAPPASMRWTTPCRRSCRCLAHPPPDLPSGAPALPLPHLSRCGSSAHGGQPHQRTQTRSSIQPILLECRCRPLLCDRRNLTQSSTPQAAVFGDESSGDAADFTLQEDALLVLLRRLSRPPHGSSHRALATLRVCPTRPPPPLPLHRQNHMRSRICRAVRWWRRTKARRLPRGPRGGAIDHIEKDMRAAGRATWTGRNCLEIP
jgi:hypothetical protein